MDESKRAFLRAAGVLLAGGILQKRLAGKWGAGEKGSAHKIVLVIFGGVRHAETFSPQGLVNVPHLSHDLMPKALFYPQVRNEGVTAHFNATSSIFTGNWQRVDDWGKLPPTTPTFFEYFRKQLGVPQSEVWIVASNKALTNMIASSALSSYGPRFGANVVFPKQLLITAVETALREGRNRSFADPSKVQAELEATLQGSNYEGLGWTVFDGVQTLDPSVRPAIRAAVANFVQSGVPTTGDELTFFISREILRKFAPTLLVVIFSDVEAAHFGSYSMHLAGIHMADRLCYELWQEIEANAEYRGCTTLVILPEFGRDPDGSNTNGFFNHRANHTSTRTTWMMCLGAAVERPQTVERPIHHIDLCPTLASLVGCQMPEALGSRLPEFRA
ncbi:MAG TPA: hypothetical protein VEO19_12670 [Terriglobia bacterium]|nr:hypothetical protein [Terriglobia bacterium]